MKRLLIYSLFIMAFFANPLVQKGLMPFYFTLWTEIGIILLCLYSLLYSLTHKRFRFFGWFSLLAVVITTMFSMGLNSQFDIRPIFSLRFLLRFYFLFIAMINIGLTEKDLKTLNGFILIILLIQLPVVAYKFSIYGISEMTIGTYELAEGSLTTSISFMVIIYLISYHGLYKPRLIFLILIIAFFGWGVVGGKRAIFFLAPFVATMMYLLVYHKGKKRIAFKKGLILGLFGAGVFVCIIAGLIFIPTLNPEGKVGGSVDFKYAVDYAGKYTADETSDHYTRGRFSTTKRIYSVLLHHGLDHFLFGFGPGSRTKSVFDPPNWKWKDNDKFKIIYGVTPSTQIAIEYGIVGTFSFGFLVASFVLLSRRYNKIETDPYWKAFATGSYGFSILMLFFYFAYHSPIFLGDTMPILYYYAMAVVFIRHEICRKQSLKIVETRKTSSAV